MFSETLPTPLQKIRFHNKSFWIKRDDLIHPVICGNKWRKLEGWVDRIASVDTVISFGGAYSNHLPALAELLSWKKKKGIFLVRGNELDAQSSEQLRFCQEKGARLVFISRSEYSKLREKAWEISNVLKAELGVHDQTLIIPEGGFGEEVLEGCAKIWDEILASEIDPDHLILPSGTGATALGILKRMPFGCNTKMHVVSAVKGAIREQKMLESLARAKAIDLIFIDDLHGGFGKFPQILQVLRDGFVTQTGIAINRNYSPKALEYLSRVDVSGTVVFLHTGGFKLAEQHR